MLSNIAHLAAAQQRRNGEQRTNAWPATKTKMKWNEKTVITVAFSRSSQQVVGVGLAENS